MNQPRRRSALAPVSHNRVSNPRRPSRPQTHTFPTKSTQMAQEEDNTQSSFSNSSGSLISGTSLLDTEELPDDLRRALRHERDRKRMRDAVEGGAVRAFSKGSVSRVAEAMNRRDTNLRDINDAVPNATGAASTRRTSLSDSDHLAPPNIPRQWGNKGRQRNDFLRRINSDGPLDERPRTPDDPDVIYPRRTAFTGDSPRSDIDWTATAADVPLPPADPDSPIGKRGSPRLGSFRRRVQRHSSLDRITEYDQEQVALTQDATEKSRPISAGQTGASSGYKASNEEKTSVVAYRSSRMSPLSQHETKAPIKGPQPKTSARRQGSRELLRQLARASSTTPSPAGVRQAPLAEMSTSKPQQTSSGDVDHRLPTPPEGDPATLVERKRRLKTPHITGGWEDTPAGESRPPQQPSTPPPKSALASILASTPHDASLGDTTIAFLREIVDENDGTPLDLDDETLELVQNVTVRLNAGAESGADLRQEEREQLKRMNGFLRKAQHGVRDTSRGLKRVERSVEDAADTDDGRFAARTLDAGPSCELCGCPGGSGATLSGILSAALTSLRSRFIIVRPQSKRGPARLTWAGLLALTLLVWSVLEITLCAQYCHPRYASSMRGYGVRVHAPRFPFVAGTVLFQWPVGWAVVPVVRPVLWVVEAVVYYMLGIERGGGRGSGGGGGGGFVDAESSKYGYGYGREGLGAEDVVGFGFDEVV